MLGLTLALALFSFVLTWVLAIPAGIYSATHPRSIGDHVLTIINYVGVATPNFMLALVLMVGGVIGALFRQLGRTPPAAPDELAAGFMALAHGLALQRVAGRPDPSGRLILLFLRGLLAA